VPDCALCVGRLLTVALEAGGGMFDCGRVSAEMKVGPYAVPNKQIVIDVGNCSECMYRVGCIR